MFTADSFRCCALQNTAETDDSNFIRYTYGYNFAGLGRMFLSFK